MFDWNIIGYIGVFFASIYRIPQITKIYKSKKGSDVSKRSFILQNGAYVAFIIYVSGKSKLDYILLVYYFIGLIQNTIIISMKKYYKMEEMSNTDINPIP